MQSFSILHIPPSANNGQQIVFVHHSEYRFGIAMCSVSLQPDVYPAVPVSISALCLTLFDLLGQRQILCRDVHAMDIVVIPAARHTEEAAHLTDAVFLPMTVDYFVFDDRLHSLPVSKRKSRSNAFSIFNR